MGDPQTETRSPVQVGRGAGKRTQDVKLFLGWEKGVEGLRKSRGALQSLPSNLPRPLWEKGGCPQGGTHRHIVHHCVHHVVSNTLQGI